jgi:hypothetical protein
MYFKIALVSVDNCNQITIMCQYTLQNEMGITDQTRPAMMNLSESEKIEVLQQYPLLHFLHSRKCFNHVGCCVVVFPFSFPVFPSYLLVTS